MDTLISAKGASVATRRRSVSVLTKWLLVTLGAIIIMLLYLQVVVVGSFSPPLVLVLGTPALLAAIVIFASRRPWAPLFGVVYWILLFGLNTSHLAYDIAHPEILNVFAFTIIVLVLTVVGVAAGISSTIQNYRARAAKEMADEVRHLPRWFPAMLWLLAGLSVGAILMAAFAPTRASAAVSKEILATLPSLGADHTMFEKTELRAKVGETVALRLDNRESQLHTFNIDEFDVHVSMPPGEPALGLFKALKPGTYTFYCDVPGHRQAGMVGTLIVAP